MANQVQQAQAAGSEFFNLHVSGIGYLNRVRWVEVGKARNGRRSEPFLCCSVNALHGSAANPDRTYFDLKVSGKEAIELIDSLAEAVNARRKVLISFKAGDIYPHVYERKVRDDNGRETGQCETAALIKGRLIRINTVKVDGELVHQRSDDAPEEGDLQQSNPAGATDVAPEEPAPAAAEPQRQYAARPAQGRTAPENQGPKPRRTQYAKA